MQGEFEKKWQKEVSNKLTDAANATRAEEKAAVRASTEAAQVPVLYRPRDALRHPLEGAVTLNNNGVIVGSSDACFTSAVMSLLSFWQLLVQTARTEGLMARAEMLTAALDTLGHRLSDAQSLAASQCEPVSLDDKVRQQHALSIWSSATNRVQDSPHLSPC